MNPMVAVPAEKLVASLKRVKRGGLTVRSKNANIMELKVADREISIDVQSIDAVKEFIGPLKRIPFSFPSGEEEEEKSILDQLKMMKGFAEELKNEKMTITVRRAGDTIIVIGDKAKPRLSRLVLGSDIQADTIKILSLIRKLR